VKKMQDKQYFSFLLLLLFCMHSAFAQDSVAKAYTLGAGDTIQVLVYDEDDLSIKAQLGNEGTLNYPFLGEVILSGMSVAQVEKVIRDGLLGDYLIEPKVSVSVVSYRQFFINGQVEDPGGFSFQPGLTIGKAISLAGGFTERASKKEIYVVSEGDEQAQPKKVKLNDPVHPGDIVTVQQSFF